MAAVMSWDLVNPDVMFELERLDARILEDIIVPEAVVVECEFSDNRYIIGQNYLALECVLLDHRRGMKFDDVHEELEEMQFDFAFPLNHRLWNTHDHGKDLFFTFGTAHDALGACIYLPDGEELNNGDPTVAIVDFENEGDDSILVKTSLSEFLATQSI
jgi:hypothetical protein